MKKVLSFVIPVHNEAVLIESTLSQLKKLTLPHEVIVSDDVSTDETVSRSAKYADWVITTRTKYPTIAANRNAGAKTASGEFLVFLDADSYIENPDAFFARALSQFADDETLSGLTGRLRVHPHLETFGDKVVYPLFNLVHKIKNNNLHMGEASGKFQMIRRSTFEELGGFNEKLVTREDADMFARLSKRGKTRYDGSLCVLHTGRRGHAYGWPKLLSIWMLNAIAVGLTGRALAKVWKPLRTSLRYLAPTISLIIPAYNEEHYIGLTLEKAIKHAGSMLQEIIVIDNASTDNTRAVAQSYPGVRVVYEERKGITRARQRGFLEAKGDILAYIDADTLIQPTWVKKIRREFSKNQNLVCLSGPGILYDMPLLPRTVGRIYWYTLAWPLSKIVGFMAYGANFSIRRDIVEKMGGFDTSIEFYGEDTNIARRASELGKVTFTPRFFVYTSGRRLKGQGVFSTGLVYAVNFFSETMLRRPATKEYKDFR